MDTDLTPANQHSINEICNLLANSVTNIFPKIWNPKVSFTTDDNPATKVLAGEYQFRVSFKVPVDGNADSKVKLGDLLTAFEDAFNAGWDAAIIKADYGEDRKHAFSEWLAEEMKRLGLEEG